MATCASPESISAVSLLEVSNLFEHTILCHCNIFTEMWSSEEDRALLRDYKDASMSDIESAVKPNGSLSGLGVKKDAHAIYRRIQYLLRVID